MKNTLLFVLATIATLAVALVLRAVPLGDTTSEPSAGSVFVDGEDLVYQVSWTFLKLGTIHIKTSDTFKAIAYIDSYEGLPVVDLHSIHYTEMDSTFHTKHGYAIDKDGNDWKGLRYNLDASNSRVSIERLFQKNPTTQPYKVEANDSIRLKPSTFVDGLAIGYLPRLFIHETKTLNVQTLLKGDLGVTTFYFTNEGTTESIDALDNPVRVVKVEGTTNAVGVFGMTGDFTGWFSDDAAAVPIKGKLKVLLGNVTVELIKWNRKGWSPPTGSD